MSADDSRIESLPDVPEATLESIEARVFDAIAADRASRSAAAHRRRRLWSTVAVAAAILAVAAVISPSVLQGLGGGSGSTSVGAAESSAVAPDAAPDGAADRGAGADAGWDALADGPTSGSAEAGVGSEAEGSDEAALAEREVIRTGTASVVVDDAASAADAIVRLAGEHAGWVEQLSIGADGALSPLERTGDAVPVPVPHDGGYVAIRVPADALDAVMGRLADIGEVTSTRVATQDVTAQAVDLRARIDAARASVERLTELLAASGSVGELVNVEGTLSERQADLESLERQLESLEGQIAMSTLSISLLSDAPRVEPDPAGFGDGLTAGWNGLLATLNGVVVGVGFLLPWLGVLGLTWLIVWAVRRAARRRRAAEE
ncbi:DUF4349 domain-containing protein [Microbacterium sp. NPDC096154]|uniref:DUF4349 domain-containing protein n=1 Tax=Microbacterium sp. NPDC096154 TaxID=3155549 RepID=UPI0033325C3B